MVQLSFLSTALPRVLCVHNVVPKSVDLRNFVPMINNVLSSSYARKPKCGGTLPINVPLFNQDKDYRIPNPVPKRKSILRTENEFQEIIEDKTEENRLKSEEIIQKVNNHIASGNAGRLFAIIHVHAKQIRVAVNDIVVLERWWPPTVGDKIIFEKVLLVGGSSFSLIGKPVLPNNLVRVHATIINKDLTHTKIRFRHIPKERVHRLNFVREETTYLRINDIELHPKLNVTEPAVYTRA